MTDPVEDYLDELYAALRVSPRTGRRILAETEDHLRDAVADGLAHGLSEDAAAHRAVQRFGPSGAVARAHRVRLNRRPPAAAGAGMIRMAWLLAAVGLIAIGVSGAVAAGMTAVFGHAFVGGTPAGTTWSAADCGHFLAVWPSAHGCAQAAALENSADAVSLRGLAGVGGLILLAGYRAAGRWRGTGRGWGLDGLPDSFPPAVGTVVFGTAGVLLTGIAIDLAAFDDGHGTGFYLSGGIVALGVAAGYAVPLYRALLAGLTLPAATATGSARSAPG
jgi:hypothetical protein